MTEEFALGVVNELETKIFVARKAAASLSTIRKPGVHIKLEGLDGSGKWRSTNITTFDPANPEVDGVPDLARWVDSVRPLGFGHFPVVVHAGDEAFVLTLYDLVPGTDINAAVESN